MLRPHGRNGVVTGLQQETRSKTGDASERESIILSRRDAPVPGVQARRPIHARRGGSTGPAAVNELWMPSTPVAQLVLRGLIVYAALLVLIRLSGKRTIGEFTPFDFVVLILLGEASQNGLVGDDHSITGALVLVATLIGANWLLAFLSARSETVDRLVEGSPQVLARNGAVVPGALRANNLSQTDFDESLRRARCTLDRVWLALLETDGRITVLKTGEQVPLPEKLK